MARGRMVNQSIAVDPEFNSLSPLAQLLYLRTIPHLDRDGLTVGTPTALWARVAPLMEDFLPITAACIDEWVGARLVVRFVVKGSPFLWFTGFTKNQNIRYDREGESIYPCPPGMVRTSAGLVPDGQTEAFRSDSDTNFSLLRNGSEPTPELLRSYSGVTPESLQNSSRVTPPEVKLKEGEGRRAPAGAHARENMRNAPPAPSSAQSDSIAQKSDISGYVNALTHIWGRMVASAYEAEVIEDWAKRVPLEGWEYGLRESAANNARNMRYLSRILERVEREGMPVLVPAANTGQTVVNGVGWEQI